MSTVKSNNHQVGQSATANQNFTIYQPAVPDGTVRIGVGNAGATTSDAVTLTNAGNMTTAGTIKSNSGGFVFPDNSTQTTAAVSAYVGARGQVFTGNGTFTIPTSITALKITVVGGGGGGGGSGGSGTAGGTSSVASGTQTISTISATGGSGGVNGFSYAAGGSGSGGTQNLKGWQGSCDYTGSGISGGPGGGTVFGGGGETGVAGAANTGGGGGGFVGGGCTNGRPGGGGGGAAISYLTGLTPGNTLAVTIGGGGTGAATGGANGAAGVVVFEW